MSEKEIGIIGMGSHHLVELAIVKAIAKNNMDVILMESPVECELKNNLKNITSIAITNPYRIEPKHEWICICGRKLYQPQQQ